MVLCCTSSSKGVDVSNILFCKCSKPPTSNPNIPTYQPPPQATPSLHHQTDVKELTRLKEAAHVLRQRRAARAVRELRQAHLRWFSGIASGELFGPALTLGYIPFKSSISCGYISSSVMCLQYIFSMCMWYVYIYIYVCVCVFWNMMIECVYPLMMLEVSRPKSFELY